MKFLEHLHAVVREEISKRGHWDKMQMTKEEFEIPGVGRVPRISQGLLPFHLYIRLLNIILSVLSLFIFVLKFSLNIFKAYGTNSWYTYFLCQHTVMHHSTIGWDLPARLAELLTVQTLWNVLTQLQKGQAATAGIWSPSKGTRVWALGSQTVLLPKVGHPLRNGAYGTSSHHQGQTWPWSRNWVIFQFHIILWYCHWLQSLTWAKFSLYSYMVTWLLQSD